MLLHLTVFQSKALSDIGQSIGSLCFICETKIGAIGSLSPKVGLQSGRPFRVDSDRYP